MGEQTVHGHVTTGGSDEIFEMHHGQNLVGKEKNYELRIKAFTGKKFSPEMISGIIVGKESRTAIKSIKFIFKNQYVYYILKCSILTSRAAAIRARVVILSLAEGFSI